jgi:hypothetical protein
MAIIDKGEILLEAEPLHAVAEMEGVVWERLVSKEELPAIEQEHAVLSTKLSRDARWCASGATSAPRRPFTRWSPTCRTSTSA